jgi:hypothetical protein
MNFREYNEPENEENIKLHEIKVKISLSFINFSTIYLSNLLIYE